MIYVTSGHEKGIGLEVFLKSLRQLPRPVAHHCLLLVDQKVLIKQLKYLAWHYRLAIDPPTQKFQLALGKHLSLAGIFLDNFMPARPRSSAYLIYLWQKLRPTAQDIVFTLPTSKDQLFWRKPCLGHTEWLRQYFNLSSISMNFKAPHYQMLLITDHLPLAKVSAAITADLIVKRVTTSLDGWAKYFTPIKEVYVAGINPHAGENGLLGQEDGQVVQAIQRLRRKFPRIKFQGPFPGDTLLRNYHPRKAAQQLWVFMYHDQGLPWFKGVCGLKGINLSFGLPFLRLSVDHGTAFSLYGKNQADPAGTAYVLREAYRIMRQF